MATTGTTPLKWGGNMAAEINHPMRSLGHLHSHSEAETHAIGIALAKVLVAGDVLALDGPLGSGKTCLVRGIADGLGLPTKAVSSPTFVISQEYADDDLTPLVHIDAYRLSGPDDLETIGWEELMQSGEAVVAVEWPSRITAALPRRLISIAFTHAGEHDRLLSISAAPTLVERLQSVDWPPSVLAQRVNCRICGTPVETTSPAFPFCSDRCRLADLNAWFTERYRTSRAVEANDELTE